MAGVTGVMDEAPSRFTSLAGGVPPGIFFGGVVMVSPALGAEPLLQASPQQLLQLLSQQWRWQNRPFSFANRPQ